MRTLKVIFSFGLLALVAKAQVPVAPSGLTVLASPVLPTGERLVGSHHMIAMRWAHAYGDQAQYDEEARRWKAQGMDFVSLYFDAYDNNYPTILRMYYNACQKAGILASAGFGPFYWADNPPGGDSFWPAKAWMPQIVKDTKDHPAQWKIDGKPVYTAYELKYWLAGQRYWESILKPALAAQGLQNVLIWPHRGWLQPPFNSSANVYHTTAEQSVVEGSLNSTPEFLGLANFSADMSSAQIVACNRALTLGARAKGKKSMAGVTPFYGSHSLIDMGGFKGVDEQWRGILVDKPDAVWWVTTDDYKELSYMGDLPQTPIWTNHWNKGDMADPLDHSGWRKFAEPHLQAYKQGASTITISQDRLFICYQLHPKGINPDNSSPQHMYGGRAWRNQLPDRIFVAAHLTAPAQLRINNSTSSTTYSAGTAHFDIALTVGSAPVVSIVRNGNVIKTATAPLPITNNPRPGAWNYLAIELP